MKQTRAMITRILDRDMNNLQTKFATSYPEFEPRRELHSQSRRREMAVAAVPSGCYPHAVWFVRLPTYHRAQFANSNELGVGTACRCSNVFKNRRASPG